MLELELELEVAAPQLYCCFYLWAWRPGSVEGGDSLVSSSAGAPDMPHCLTEIQMIVS